MKFLIVAVIFLNLQAFAQVATAPDGASSVSAPPVGEARRSNCGGKNCFQVNIQPYCFGTNLRGYAHDIQLKQAEPVSVKLNIGGASGDQLDFVFPATLTFNPNGTKPICLPKSGQNLATSGSKTFICPVNDSGVISNVEYLIADWKGTKNPGCYANGGSHGLTFCDYAARPLPASRTAGSLGDEKIICFYSFNGSYALKDEVICQFPSLMQDESSSVKVAVNGAPSTDGEIKAVTNSIQVRLPLSKLPFISASSQLSQGTRMMPKKGDKLASSKVTFAQIQSDNSLRPLEKDNYQLPERTTRFDEANGNMSFTIVAKFPGDQGFCGGFYSPLMLFFSSEYPRFNGISFFPLHGVKDGGRINWPEAGSKGYFLAYLKEGEKEISKASQLFGQDGINANGFESLKLHDSDKNGVINKNDKIWNSLKLWNDANSNGLSEVEEIQTLGSKSIESISLNYNSHLPLKFEGRARARERSSFSYKKNGKITKAEIIDVWLAPID